MISRHIDTGKSSFTKWIGILMTMAKITLPIRYWDQGPTRRISTTDNGRTIEVAYFNYVKFTGLSKHYPLPLLYSYKTKKL